MPLPGSNKAQMRADNVRGREGGGELKGSLGRAMPQRPSNPDPVQDMAHFANPFIIVLLISFVLHKESRSFSN